MKIAILGGSFDPPHLGHLFIAMQVKEILSMDQIWLMPLYQKSSQAEVFHKTLTDVSNRLAMSRLLENDYIRASDFEIKHNHTSFTIDTLDTLTKQNPSDEFFWIFGSDQLASFQQYYKWKEIITKHRLIIFPREWILPQFEEKVKQALQLQSIPENVIVLHEKGLLLTNISSTKIRERVRKHLPVKNFVPIGIEEYIKKHTLYVDN